jgi:hypothetical protein
VFAALLTLANVVMLALGREALTNDDGDLFFGILIAVGGVLYVAIGRLIAVRARNVIWVVPGGRRHLVRAGDVRERLRGRGDRDLPGVAAGRRVGVECRQRFVDLRVGHAVAPAAALPGRPSASPLWRAVLWLTNGGAGTISLRSSISG